MFRLVFIKIQISTTVWAKEHKKCQQSISSQSHLSDAFQRTVGWFLQTTDKEVILWIRELTFCIATDTADRLPYSLTISEDCSHLMSFRIVFRYWEDITKKMKQWIMELRVKRALQRWVTNVARYLERIQLEMSTVRKLTETRYLCMRPGRPAQFRSGFQQWRMKWPWRWQEQSFSPFCSACKLCFPFGVSLTICPCPGSSAVFLPSLLDEVEKSEEQLEGEAECMGVSRQDMLWICWNDSLLISAHWWTWMISQLFRHSTWTELMVFEWQLVPLYLESSQSSWKSVFPQSVHIERATPHHWFPCSLFHKFVPEPIENRKYCTGSQTSHYCIQPEPWLRHSQKTRIHCESKTRKSDQSHQDTKPRGRTMNHVTDGDEEPEDSEGEQGGWRGTGEEMRTERRRASYQSVPSVSYNIDFDFIVIAMDRISKTATPIIIVITEEVIIDFRVRIMRWQKVTRTPRMAM